MPEGKFSNRRCPRCGASLLTDGRAFWCTSVVAGRPGDPSDRVCRYRAESEAELDHYQPAAVPAEKPPLAELFRHAPDGDGLGKYLVKRRDGSVVEWPSFVLGARDPHAAYALRAYAQSIANDPDCLPSLPVSIYRLADEFDAYRAEHGAGDPTRGKHRPDDPATLAEMRKGRSA